MSIFEDSASYRPFKYPWAVEAEKKHRIDMNWHENQLELQDDLRQYNTRGGLATVNVSHDSNKNMIDKSLLLFTEMDVAVGTGYCELLPYIRNNEIRTLFITQAAREVTHQRGYAVGAETFGFEDKDWSSFKSYAAMRNKIDLVTRDCGDLSIPLNFAKKLSVMLLGEGIALFGAFSNFLNLKRFGLMSGFNSVNEWSLKDENEHVLNNMRVLNHIITEDLTPAEATILEAFYCEIVEMYVEAEYEYLNLAFEMGDQEQFTLHEAKEYIYYLGQLRIWQMGYIPKEQVPPNPLKWMDYILTGNKHTNFFEQRVVDYNHGGLKGEIDYSRYIN